MRRTALALSVVLSLAFVAAAQTDRRGVARTVTNAELEVFKQKRLNALRDYEDNYARLGFPSPMELERQTEQSRVERQELSAKLREERLERERIEADRARAEADLAAAYSVRENESFGGYGPYGYGPFFGYGAYGGFDGYGAYTGRYGYRDFGSVGKFRRSSYRLGGQRNITVPGYRITPVGVFEAPVRTPVFGSRFVIGIR